MQLTLATYNIQYGLGQDGVFDLDRIVAAVGSADIICMQEVGQHWQRNGGEDQAAAVGAALNYFYVFGSTFDADASYVSAEGRVVNRRRTFGNLVASRWPIRATRTLSLPRVPFANGGDMARCAVEAVVDVPGCPLRIYSVHLSFPSADLRRAQIEALLQYVRRAPRNGSAWDYTPGGGGSGPWAENDHDATPPAPAVVMGDFNLSPTDAEYALLAGEARGALPRLVRLDGLFDAWTRAKNDPAAGVTMRLPDRSLRLDHAFVTPDLRRAVQAMYIDTAAIGSDHQPVFLGLDLARRSA